MWYPFHAPAGLVDQQVAGLVMCVPSGAILTIVVLALGAWGGESERRVSDWRSARGERMKRGLAVLAIVVCAACSKGPEENAEALTRGNRERGRKAVLTYGCHGCHDIPQVPGGQGAVVGPALGGVRKRTYLAGRIPNNADSMVRYIQSPQSVDPKTAMPNLGVREQDARDIAAFLYSLP